MDGGIYKIRATYRDNRQAQIRKLHSKAVARALYKDPESEFGQGLAMLELTEPDGVKMLRLINAPNNNR